MNKAMPKKHQPIFTKPPSTYVHPSLESSRSSPSTAPSAPRTVNDRISQLRREQAPRPSPERWNEITDVVTQRTVPPGLRHILNIPEVDPPLPKPGTRRTELSRTRRPPPGPAAPTSWLHRSRYVPPQIRELNERPAVAGESGYIPVKFSSLATLNDGFKVCSCLQLRLSGGHLLVKPRCNQGRPEHIHSCRKFVTNSRTEATT